MRLARPIYLPVLAALLAVAAAAADRGVEIYKARQRPAAELLPLATLALGEQGSAAVDEGTNALVLIGDRTALARALELLRTQDVARRSVLLRYESRRRDEIAAQGIRVDWSLGVGDLRVGSVVVPAQQEGVRVLSSRQVREEEGGFRGVVRVLDGETAHIGSGRSVPVRSLEELAFVEAERGFEARPRILGDGRVRLEIRPSDAELDATGRTRFTLAATTVVVQEGETVAVGEVARRAERRASGSRVIDSADSREQRVLLLTVELSGE